MLLAALLLLACGPSDDPVDTLVCDDAEAPYDGIDQDCDGTDLTDVDGDGYAAVEGGGDDCDDEEESTFPAAPDAWYDGVDTNCDWDQDGDGHPTEGAVGSTCEAPVDCDDLAPAVGHHAVVSLSPTDGAPAAYYRTTVEVTLDVADPSATLVVVDAAGAPVAGVVSEEDTRIVFTADEPLALSKIYKATLEFSCPTVSWAFTTGEIAPVGDLSTLVGQAWEIDFEEMDWVSPPELVALLEQQTAPSTRLLGVTAATADTLELILAQTDALTGAQDLCVPTTPLPTASLLADPIAAVGPEDVMNYVDGAVLFQDVTGAGELAPDGSAIYDLDWQLTVDLRSIDLSGDDDPCGFIGTFGGTCTPCPDGSGTSCLTLGVALAKAPEVAGPVVARSEDDVFADPACP